MLFIVANFCKCSRGPQSVATQLRVLFATTIVPRYTAKSEKFGYCWLERCWNSPNDILEFNFYYTTFSYHFLFPCFFHLDSQNICQNNRVFSLAAAYLPIYLKLLVQKAMKQIFFPFASLENSAETNKRRSREWDTCLYQSDFLFWKSTAYSFFLISGIRKNTNYLAIRISTMVVSKDGEHIISSSA